MNSHLHRVERSHDFKITLYYKKACAGNVIANTCSLSQNLFLTCHCPEEHLLSFSVRPSS